MDYLEYSCSHTESKAKILSMLGCSSAAGNHPRSFNLQLPTICYPGLDGKCSLSRVSSGYTRGSPPTPTCPHHLIGLSQMPEESQLAQSNLNGSTLSPTSKAGLSHPSDTFAFIGFLLLSLDKAEGSNRNVWGKKRSILVKVYLPRLAEESWESCAFYPCR